MLDHNDPRLIDYALGEMTPEEAKEFEAELNLPENAEALKAMKEFQTVAGAATQALAAEPAGQLRAEQRKAVIEQASTPANVTPMEKARRSRLFRVFVDVVAVAACLLVISAIAIPNLLRSRGSSGGHINTAMNSAKVAEIKSQLQARPDGVSASGGNVSVYSDPTQHRGSAMSLPLGFNESPSTQDIGAGGAVAPEKAEATRVNEAQPQEAPVNRYMADANTPASAPPPAPPAPQTSDDRLRRVTSEEAKVMGLVAASPPPAPGDKAKVAETEADESLDDLLEIPIKTMSQQTSIGDEEGHSLGYVPSPAGRDKADAIASVQESASAPAPAAEPAPAPPEEKPMQAPASNVAVTTAPEIKDQGAASEGTREMKPIDVEYPEPFFGGTPLDYWGPNLEPQDYRDPRTIANEKYLPIVENVFLNVMNNPLSTFSIDVDTGAYSNVRRFLNQGQMPPPDAVRIEEMINYFKYDLAQPTGEAPFSVTIEMADCPWAQGHKLARVALQGRTVVSEERNPANLVFLIDVSGSMSNANKLPLAKEAMKALLNELEPRDRVAIVTYASGVSVPLNSTPCTEKDLIRSAIDSLGAGGSTNGSGGIQQAYQIARANFIAGGINRVLLATDGDFNVGTTSHDALMNLIATEAKSKVFLTVMGFGYGNIKDGTLEQIADKGNGNYAYIDNYAEARRVLVDQINGTLVTIAKDVKIQVEFNPQHIQAYRLIGYENRALEDRDFNDDTKDAGEIGAGHQVTALYQLVPGGASIDPGVDQLRYQPKPQPEAVLDGPSNPEWMTVKLRYKEPDGDTSKLIELPCANTGGAITQATDDMKFVASVAAFGMMLRHSQYQGTASYDRVIALADAGKKGDPERQACIDMMVTAKTLAVSGQQPVPVHRHRPPVL